LNLLHPQRAASIFATSILFISIIASKARLAFAACVHCASEGERGNLPGFWPVDAFAIAVMRISHHSPSVLEKLRLFCIGYVASAVQEYLGPVLAVLRRA